MLEGRGGSPYEFKRGEDRCGVQGPVKQKGRDPDEYLKGGERKGKEVGMSRIFKLPGDGKKWAVLGQRGGVHGGGGSKSQSQSGYGRDTQERPT